MSRQNETLEEALRRLVASGAIAAGRGAHPPEPHPEDTVFASYLSGSLEAFEKERFETHLATCANCAEDFGGCAVVEEQAFAQTRSAASAAQKTTAAPEARHGPARSREITRWSDGPAPVRTARQRPRRIARPLAIAVALVLFVALGLTAAGDRILDSLTANAAARLTAALARPVRIGDLALAFAPQPGLRIKDLQIADDPRFSPGPLLEVATAALAVDLAALWRGRLRGSVRLDRPSLQLVRDARGQWNIETLRGESRTSTSLPPAGPGDSADMPSREPMVRLTAGWISGGKIAIADRVGDRERELVVEGVDFNYESPEASAPARIELAGEIGGRALIVRGEIGPFAGATAPRYRFAEISFAKVDLSTIPGAPRAILGELSFAGRIEATGRTLDTIVASAAGAGSLELCCGALESRNLERELVLALAGLVPPGALSASEAGIDTGSTRYRYLGGEVGIGAGRIDFARLELETPFFAARTRGSVSREGDVDIRGSVTLGSELTQALVTAAPALAKVLRSDPPPAIPFTLAGRWPDARLEVDVTTAIRIAVQPYDPRRLMLSFRFPLRATG